MSLHHKYPTMGTDSLFHLLRQKWGCGRNRILKIKRAANIISTRHKAYKSTTNSNHNNPISPNRLGRKYRATHAHQAWVSDITYIKTGQGWLYVAIVKDLYTKKVVGYAQSLRIDTQLVVQALQMAITRQRPPQGTIFHSDRGVQYTAKAFRRLLTAHGFAQSMSRKADPYDNAVAENFFSCLKCECTHLQYFATRLQAMQAVFHYIEAFYNNIRPHSGIHWMTPNAFEKTLDFYPKYA